MFRTGDQSANVTADAQSGIWAAPNSDSTGASGAWQRMYAGPVEVQWYGTGTGATAVSAAATTGSMVVAPQSGYVASAFASPPSNAHSSWLLTNQPDGRSIGTGGLVNGPFSDYPQTAAVKLYTVNTAAQPTSGMSDTSGFVLNALDNDTTAYTNAAFTTFYGKSIYVSGYSSAGAYTTQQKKNIVGLDIVVAANTGDTNLSGYLNGNAGVTTAVIQYGSGICDNEFAVYNPSIAGGGQAQSLSMAAVQGIVYSNYAASDASHTAYCFFATNASAGGNEITAAYGLAAGKFANAINLTAATCSNAAIVMPNPGGSATGTAGTQVIYAGSGGTSYTQYDRTNTIFQWVIGGSYVASISPKGLALAADGTTSYASWLYIDPGTTAKSQIRLYPGVAPTSPADGDIWYDGTNLFMRNGGTTRTITWV